MHLLFGIQMESQLLITIQLAHNLLVYLSTEITLFIYLVELRMVYTFGRMIISISQRKSILISGLNFLFS